MGTAKEQRVRAILERSKKSAAKERSDERNGISVLQNGQAYSQRSEPKQTAKEQQKELAFRQMGLYATEHNENDKDNYSLNKRNFENGVPSNANVIVTRMNHLLEIQHMKTMNFKSHIKNLPQTEEGKRQYVLLETGEIHECNESDNRGENKNSLQKTFKKLRYLINNNFTGEGNELHVTLTFAKKVYDTSEFYDIFDKYMKRLRYHYKKINKDVKIEYINVIEPHADGSWHCHLLLRFDGLEKVFIKNDVMREIWGQGFVTIRTLEKVDNIGAYLSAYLSDIDVTGENINSEMVITKKVDGVEKKFLKGGRLHYYDVGVNIYRSSKGIIEPERENMKFKDIKKVVGNVKPNYSSKKTIENENYSNEITYLQYNLKRK